MSYCPFESAYSIFEKVGTHIGILSDNFYSPSVHDAEEITLARFLCNCTSVASCGFVATFSESIIDDSANDSSGQSTTKKTDDYDIERHKAVLYALAVVVGAIGGVFGALIYLGARESLNYLHSLKQRASSPLWQSATPIKRLLSKLRLLPILSRSAE